MNKNQFRGWNGHHMIENPIVVDSKWFETARDFEDYRPCSGPLMQYTGLKDKNGVKILESDIVRILYTDWPSNPAPDNEGLEEYKRSISTIGKIIFKGCRFCIQFTEDGFTGSIHSGTHGEIEVIGNIHEHPELLEVKK